MQRNLIKFIEQLEKKMNNLKFLLFVVIIFCSFLWTSVDGSMSNSRMTGPSPPRNLRRSAVGVLGDREYHIFWTASSDTGGSAVNYSVKLCLNDSSVENNSCKWSSKPQCMPTNITCTTKKFSCTLDRKPYYNYILCVVASNAVGNSESCISAPRIPSGLATPRPPLDFSAKIDTERSGNIKVRWREREAWYYRDTVYTIHYHAEGQPNKTKEVANKTTFTVLSSLKPFTIYCIYIVVQTLTDDLVRSAPSNVLGPICLKTPAGNPDKPPMVEWDQSVVFPDNAALRNVTVGWKLAKNSSWRGTPHEYHIYCNYHLLNAHPPAAKKCEYHIDAASNKVVLQELNTAYSYNVYIEMWNEEGKQSVPGDTYIVKELQDNSTQLTATEQGKLSSTQIGLIVGSVLIGLATAGIVLFFFRKWWQERNNTPLIQGRLDERLHLGNPCGNMYALPDSEVQHQYSQLNIDVHGENV